MVEITDLRKVVTEVEQKEAEEITKVLLAQGVDPFKILEDGIVKGLNDLGAGFEARKAFVPDLVKGGILARACIPYIQEALPKESVQELPQKIVIGTMLSQPNPWVSHGFLTSQPGMGTSRDINFGKEFWHG